MKKTKNKIKKPKHPFFKGIPSKYQKPLLQNARSLKLSDGEFVFTDHAKAEEFYLILKGTVDLLTKEQDVRMDPEEKLGVLQSLKSGDIVGWSWIIPPYRWRFHARAGENTELLVLDGKLLRNKIAKDPVLGFHIYKKLAPVMNDRLIAARLKLATFGMKLFEREEGG